jgi:hypothetical protein
MGAAPVPVLVPAPVPVSVTRVSIRVANVGRRRHT